MGRRPGARLPAQRAIYLRGTNGRLFSKPANSLDAKYLLSGMAVCGVCGGTFVAKLSSHRIAARRHVRYVCHSYLVKGSSVCANAVTLPRAATERTVLQMIEATLLRPDATVPRWTARWRSSARGPTRTPNGRASPPRSRRRRGSWSILRRPTEAGGGAGDPRA